MHRAIASLLALVAALPLRGLAADDGNAACLECHADASMSFDLEGGEKLALFVDGDRFQKSVHGEQGLSCTDCHPGTKPDHATGTLPWKTRHELAQQASAVCKGCHDTQAAEGIHHAPIARGQGGVPACSECHGAHDVLRPKEFRTHIPGKCGACHEKEATSYAGSVHGRAVDSNDDVPVCTDCHRVHKNADTSPGALSLRTPLICGRCHTDAKRMKKYGISTRVVATYLADFHGMVTTLQRGTERGEGVKLAAGCTDCHGVHDIQRTDDPRSRVIAANLQKTCQRCHDGAPSRFPQAWLSHWEPSPRKAPAVWAVRQFYRLLIPFMVGGLVLQISLHVWRMARKR
ncbi:MAG TPA: cytochrome c3 family protein [Anaeromyxobacter sp.]|nr:cytochrome c3 family protein [Anaeromyxobacter sp.]